MISTVLILGIFVIMGAGLILILMMQDKNNPRITVRDGHIEVLGFLKNKIVTPTEIEAISMDLIGLDSGGFGPSQDIVTFRFHLINNKLLTLKQNLNPKPMTEEIKGIFKNRPVPTIAVYQIKDILKENSKIKLDEYTKSYLETGNCDKLLVSRRA